jgi:hypothetical protein
MRLLPRCAVALVLLLAATGCAGGVGGTPAVGTGVLTTTPTTTTPTTTTQTSTRTSATAPDTTLDSTEETTSAADTSTSDSSEETTSTSDTSGSDTLASGVTIDELVDDLASAELIVDTYWATHWTEFFTGTYQPPTVLGLYDGTDPADTPTCDGQPLEVDNAYYCASEDYLAWDAGVLLKGADVIGDSWVYLVVARQWGHAIQARLDPSLVAAATGYQADCLGGAALFGAVADGTLQLEAGDESELIASLSVLADQLAFTDTSIYGDAFQRVEWFTIGRNGGVNACLDAA